MNDADAAGVAEMTFGAGRPTMNHPLLVPPLAGAVVVSTLPLPELAHLLGFGASLRFRGLRFLNLMLDPFVDGRSGVGGADHPALGFAPEREELPAEEKYAELDGNSTPAEQREEPGPAGSDHGRSARRGE